MSKKIMFSDKYGLTQAVLEGRKTMTRRITPESFSFLTFGDYTTLTYNDGFFDIRESKYVRYKVGEVVAVAQPYRDIVNESAKLRDILLDETGKPRDEFRAGWDNKMFTRTELLIHHIRITGIKIERLQNISEDECIKEGIRKWTKDEELFKYDLADGFEIFEWKDKPRNPREAFAVLIDSISGKGTFNSNPYVFAYEFELVD